MREININARLIDGSPRLGCIDDNATIGAMWDTGAQNLAFTRDTDLAGYDMMLHFNTGGEWLEVNVGKANSYTITNALTQSGVLGLRVSFWESSTFRYGSVNTLSFKYKESPQNSSIPEDEISQYLAILGEVSNIKTQIDAVNDSLTGEWVKLDLTSDFVAYNGVDGNIPRYKKAGGAIHVKGCVSPASANNVIGAATNVAMTAALPSGYRPTGLSAYTICQGSNRAKWLLTISTGGILNASRYADETGYITPGETAWMPFYIVFAP